MESTPGHNPEIAVGKKILIKPIARFLPELTRGTIRSMVVHLVDEGKKDGCRYFKIKRGFVEDWLPLAKLEEMFIGPYKF